MANPQTKAVITTEERKVSPMAAKKSSELAITFGFMATLAGRDGEAMISGLFSAVKEVTRTEIFTGIRTAEPSEDSQISELFCLAILVPKARIDFLSTRIMGILGFSTPA